MIEVRRTWIHILQTMTPRDLNTTWWGPLEYSFEEDSVYFNKEILHSNFHSKLAPFNNRNMNEYCAMPNGVINDITHSPRYPP